MISDYALQSDILEELQGDASVAANDVAVAVADGVVTLSGEVASLAARCAAVAAAQRVRGVRALADELTVRLPADGRPSDSDVAHAAASALMWDSEVPDKTIKVRVQDHWIWLVGEADWQYQREAAERAVRNIRGVKGVTNLVHLKRRVPAGQLQETIELALERHALLAGLPIRVAVTGNAVTLSGSVPSWPQRMAAEHVAWAADGVGEVENRLDVNARV